MYEPGHDRSVSNPALLVFSHLRNSAIVYSLQFHVLLQIFTLQRSELESL